MTDLNQILTEIGNDPTHFISLHQNCVKLRKFETKGGSPFAKMSAQIAAIYVCICILCAESAPNFQLENFLNCMHMHAYVQQKCKFHIVGTTWYTRITRGDSRVP